MKKYLVILGLSIVFANFASAHHHDGAHDDMEGHHMHDKMEMVKCMLMLKNYKTEDEAMRAAMDHVTQACNAIGMTEKECHDVKKKVGMGVCNCYTAHKFMQEFMK